jgi:hypothetical protein
VLRRIFGPKREEDGSWRELHNDELHNLNSPPNIVTVIKPRRMWWEGHVEWMRCLQGGVNKYYINLIFFIIITFDGDIDTLSSLC